MAEEKPIDRLIKNQEVTCLIDALGTQGEGICRELVQYSKYN